jgi:hypothetical protein
MPIVDYTTIKGSIADWLNRADLDSVIPTFIALAEADMNRKLRVSDMIARAITAMSDQYTSLPSDFLELQQVRLNTNPPRPLQVITPENADRIKYEKLYVAAMPQYVTVVGSALEAVPVPDQAYTVEIAYFKKIDPLTESNATNWLLTKHPDAYLYGSLTHSAPYLQDDERAALWGQAYEQVLERIRLAEERMLMGGSSPKARVKPFGY